MDFRVIFTGVCLPQKLVLLPPIERQYKPFQKHMPSYQVKISESCFVWVAPTLLRGRAYLKLEENSLRGANTSEKKVVDLNPARVKAREEVQNYFTYLENASTYKK
jgi:hypothetical protein